MTIDKSSANKAALDTLNIGKSEGETIGIRQNKYINNVIEQDHRNIKRRIRAMLGFKSFRRSQTLLAGIKTASMLRKGLYIQPKEKVLSLAAMFYYLVA